MNSARGHAAILLAILVLVSPAATRAQSPELRVLQVQYDNLVSERVTEIHNAGLAKLDAGYLAGVERSLADAKAAGDLQSALSFQEEISRITSKGALPVNDEQAAPSLKKLRSIYRTELAKLEAQRVSAQSVLLPPYIAKLKQLEADLTKADRLAEAKAVMDYRQGVAAGLPAKVDINSSPHTATPAGTNSLVVNTYYDRLAKGLNGPKKTAIIGNKKALNDFTVVPKEGAHLVGVAVKKGDWFGATIISSLQPIFETRTGRVRGTAVGKKSDDFPLLAEAKPGYVVSEIIVSAPENHVHGVKLVFRKLDVFHQELLPKASYESDWLGIELNNKSSRVGDVNKPPIGLCGRADGWIGALGLLYAP